ncbi:CRISPR-associated endoribonuclease Cas6 [Tissierella sp. Yu-01]|uniref:CRISPR-associated endoribonuclease Cas6 n=1 Tax=Tissierella sp. Yu-01 TaxID=3035694 RepID=UPI00240E0CB3|nr:CRISPR-associated endoribonuclease Cas6 [Tissierella sp. Yu-01]WFA10097.1 CRISPR-associated endoribonuclease Cas6 [Tissierella sp. Yu-01]
MRYSVELLLENEVLPKDKNRIILSLLKHNFKSYDKEYYQELYEDTSNKVKPFTFSLYMGNCKFLKEEINIPDKKIILNYSTNDLRNGIIFYNSMLQNRGKAYSIKNNSVKVNKINLLNEKTIMDDAVVFRTMSPISVREHNGDNKKTWYHTLNDENGKEIFMNNLTFQLLNEFGEERILDFREIEVIVLGNKEVKIKNYDIEVLGNICKLKIKAKPYILYYLYKAGIGSMRSSGFGMVDIV